ncbi:Ras-related small GTP-binding family protein [Perilla frutescens var. hirtella]|uniref:Ras-related small GTP-binding family protein n=1 Tax=Perilla frutescens var. hirtella TaxID=608512 RepID=A0AAD4JL90_PERFH|nr:Ras-related small GTP-binding family protein [Perilla frutescens var. hirtella]
MATHRFNEATGKMTQLSRKIVHVNIRWSIIEKATVFRQFFRFIWDRIISLRMPNPRYRRLFPTTNSSSPPPLEAMETGGGRSQEHPATTSSSSCCESDSDLVSLKISMLGDSQIGKTTFLVKYVGDEQEKRSLQMKGLNVMEKTMYIQGARIALRIWDVGGDNRSFDQVPIACKDAVAILFMFDLTSRRTLNSIIEWYNEARKWNQTAVPIVIGTKFDDFLQLPPDIQWTVITQARTYAKAMKAALFFSSAKHNINVNKIFKFIIAKLFNLPWTLHRNLTLGEPIIDF